MSSGLDLILNVSDAATRIEKLNSYIRVGEERLSMARRERVKAAMELKESGATWQVVKQLTGLTRQYLQRESGETGPSQSDSTSAVSKRSLSRRTSMGGRKPGTPPTP